MKFLRQIIILYLSVSHCTLLKTKRVKLNNQNKFRDRVSPSTSNNCKCETKKDGLAKKCKCKYEKNVLSSIKIAKVKKSRSGFKGGDDDIFNVGDENFDNEEINEMNESIYQPIRIKFDPILLWDTSHGNDDQKSFIIEKVCRIVKLLLAKWIYVIPVTDKNRITIPIDHICQKTFFDFSSQMNQDFVLNYQNYKESDLIIYLSGEENDEYSDEEEDEKAQKRFLAKGTPCLYSKMHNFRPILGKIELNLTTMDPKLLSLEEFVNIIIHEMVHILAFHLLSFHYFVDKNGNKIPNNEVIQNKCQGCFNVEHDMIITKKVVREVRFHFAKSDSSDREQFLGAFLENEGVDKTSIGNHWERRIFFNEAMTADVHEKSVFSRITFALLEDSGWYRVDYNYAMPLHWGKNAGIDFYTKGCKMDMGIPGNSEIFDKYFCKENSIAFNHCSFTKYGFGNCISDFYSDGCRYYENNRNCQKNPEYFGINIGDAERYYGFNVGSSSKCFQSTIQKAYIPHPEVLLNDGLRCYKYECLEDGNKIKIYFSPKLFIECSVEEGRKGFVKDLNSLSKSYIGTIKCPDITPYCLDRRMDCINQDNCNGHGDCIFNSCVCEDGYEGKKCEISNLKRVVRINKKNKKNY